MNIFEKLLRILFLSQIFQKSVIQCEYFTNLRISEELIVLLDKTYIIFHAEEKFFTKNDINILKDLNIPWHIHTLNEKTKNMTLKDLNYVVINHETEFKQYENIFNEMSRNKQKSAWLFDVENINEEIQTTDIFKNFDLKLTDDVFIIQNSPKNKTNINEIYKISKNLPVIEKNFGVKNDENQINFVKERKWERRKDLQGFQFQIASLDSRPYISNMVKSEETGYNMSGIFADVFFSLRVSKIGEDILFPG